MGGSGGRGYRKKMGGGGRRWVEVEVEVEVKVEEAEEEDRVPYSIQ